MNNTNDNIKKIREILSRLNNLSNENKKIILAMLLATNLSFTSIGLGLGYYAARKTYNEKSDISSTKNNENQDDEFIEVKVEPGMTLSSIAAAYNTTVEEICAINKIKDPDNIPAQTIIKVKKPKGMYIIDSVEVLWDELDGQYDKYVKGIDISYAQDGMNLDSVLKSNDIKFVIARSAYYWKYNPRDVERFKKAALTCAENNVNFGTYFWPTCRNMKEAENQLNDIRDMLDELREKEDIYLTMPVCLDIELKKDGGGDLVDRILKKDKTTLKCLKYMIDNLEKDYYTTIYCSDAVANQIGAILQDIGINVDFWISKYHNNETPVSFDTENPIIKAHTYKGASSIRQYAKTGRVKGYDGDVDIDACYKNIPAIIIENGLNYTSEQEFKKVYLKKN